jgi:hypothetical protein
VLCLPFQQKPPLPCWTWTFSFTTAAAVQRWLAMLGAASAVALSYNWLLRSPSASRFRRASYFVALTFLSSSLNESFVLRDQTTPHLASSPRPPLRVSESSSSAPSSLLLRRCLDPRSVPAPAYSCSYPLQPTVSNVSLIAVQSTSLTMKQHELGPQHLDIDQGSTGRRDRDAFPSAAPASSGYLISNIVGP